MLELGIELRRISSRTPIGWLETAAIGLFSAGLGAWLQGGKVGWLAYAAMLVGGASALVLQFALHERRVDASNVCARYLRLIDQWTELGAHGYSTNSAYVQAVVDMDNPSLKTRWRNWRATRTQRGG